MGRHRPGRVVGVALKVIDLGAQLRRIEFLVPELIPSGYITFLGAREGVGKTTIATALAWQMTRPEGRGEFLGRPVPRGPVIYLNTDAADGESRPVRYWLEQHRNSHPDGEMGGVTVLETTGAGLTPEELGELLGMARDMGARLVIVDSFMGTFPTLDGNKLDQAMRPMLALRDFAAQTGAAVIVTDHLPKKGANEKEGDRGIMGSTGKSAQARAVHLLTRVPPKEVEGRDVLRWEVRKNSFHRSGYALGIEVERLQDEEGRAYGVNLFPCDLPEEPEGQDTRSDRARAAVIALLSEHEGQTVTHAQLEAAAVQGGNVKERSARQAVREALGALGGLVREVRLGGRGAPRAYTYRPEPVRSEEALLIVEEIPPLPLNTHPVREEVLTWD
ncbi:AAA family ATPase [Deinococcus navajonensis]|uniref:AAA family ATPase n=1 Tax=Deinococcus navajonensis TaxID=309884 RepID=A0ABV8XT11_9DEIO